MIWIVPADLFKENQERVRKRGKSRKEMAHFKGRHDEFCTCWAGRNHYKRVRGPEPETAGRSQQTPGKIPRRQASTRTWLPPRPAPPRRPRRTPMIRRSRRPPPRGCTQRQGGRWLSPGPRCSGRCTSSPKAPSCCSMSTRLPSSFPSVSFSSSSSSSLASTADEKVFLSLGLRR